MTKSEDIYELQERPDKAAWERVSKENPLCLAMERAVRSLGYVLEGKLPFILFSGAAGVGKTWAIQQAMLATGIAPIIRKPANHRDLLRIFAEAAGVTPIVLEECDHIFKSSRCLNILKIATDIEGHRFEMVSEKHEGEWINVKYDLSAPLIITTNQNMNTPSKDIKLEADLSAIRSRGRPIWINSSREIMFEYSCYLAIIHRSIATIRLSNKNGEEVRVPVSTKIQDQALEWFMSQLYRLEDASPRALRRIRDMIYMHPNSPEIWQDDLQAEIFHPKERTFRLAHPPRVFAPPPKLKKPMLAAMFALLCDQPGKSVPEIANILHAEKLSVQASLECNQFFWSERGLWSADGESEEADGQEYLDSLYEQGLEELMKRSAESALSH